MPRTSKNIYKRKDGRWEARLSIGVTKQGKTKYKSIYAGSYREVKEKLAHAMFLQVGRNSRNSKSHHTFTAVAESWMKANAFHLKPATILKYYTLIDVHICSAFGNYDVADMTEELINDFLNEKRQEGRVDRSGGLSESYVNTMLIIINSVLQYAVEQGFCNSLKTRITKPSLVKKTITVLEEGDQKKLETFLMQDSSLESLGIFLALNTGLRIGEICALRWEDIDLSNRIIHVRYTISRILNPDPSSPSKTVLIMDKPKTRSSIRDIPITTKLFEFMKKYVSEDPLIFLMTGTSTFISPRTFEYRFHKKMKACHSPYINFHSLRHTFATRCIEKGVDVKTLSEILGHANVGITLNTYVHSSMALKRTQLEKLN